jgi:uncharacterized protein
MSDPAIPRRRYAPLALPDVSIADAFWAPKQGVNRERTLPHIYAQLRDTARLDAFRPGWQPEPGIAVIPIHGGGATPVMFWDSDVAKWLEATSYSLATHPDRELAVLLEGVIARVVEAQQPDGYLNTWFTAIDPQGRWSNLRDWHELYCAGHLIEAAVAHHEATGSAALIGPLRRYVEYIGATFGTEEGKLRGYCGHPEIELALIRLAHATGERRYLDLARYFVDERGRQPHYFDQEAHARKANPARFWARSYEYNQSHKPVREQEEVVGHAVRAAYLYSAMADLAAEDGDTALLAACERLWQHLTTRRMYVTGGIGTSASNEGFTADYDLPNHNAYAETCAAIALVFWARRMLEIGLDGRYGDVLELALYNAVLSGVSLDGERFFYDNPLASDGRHTRSAWFDCPCCPPNIARLLASLGSLAYAQGADEAVIHLYVAGHARFELGGQAVTLRQQTSYPWDGRVAITVEAERAASFALNLRLPGWCHSPRLSVNGEPVDFAATGQRGYARIVRNWNPGDVVELELAMPVERVFAHPAVRADQGRVAIRRGPLLYCLEQTDHAVALDRIQLPREATLSPRHEPALLGGVTVLEGQGRALADTGWDATLYGTEPPASAPCAIRAVPYYAWANREPGAMEVWIRE